MTIACVDMCIDEKKEKRKTQQNNEMINDSNIEKNDDRQGRRCIKSENREEEKFMTVKY